MTTALPALPLLDPASTDPASTDPASTDPASGTTLRDTGAGAGELPGFGGLATELGHLPLRAMDVRARIVGLDAVVELRQRFVNPARRAAEATYVFPLPARAALTSFVATLGGRRVVGTLREREVAREIYDAAIAAGHRAGIVEEERPEVFTARVGNLAPGEEAVVEIVLVHRLAVSDGEATFRFPLVVAPRYVPGAAIDGIPVGDGTALDTDAVPDASRVTPPVLLPGCPSPVALSLAVELDPAGLDLADLRCSLHALAAGAPAPGAPLVEPVRVELVPGERLDRDFLLRLRLAGDGISTSAVLVPDVGRVEREGQARTALEGEGTFLVTIVPPVAPAATVEPTDVVVVLDRSGSMGGWKMVAARRAAGRIVDALGGADRFALLAFDDVVDTFGSDSAGDPSGGGAAGIALHPATDTTRYRAVEWLAGIDARGGTELASALRAALGAVAGSSRPTVVVLVTDGQVSDEDRLAELAAQSGPNVRIHCVGIDQAVNGGLLERLSRAGHGQCELVESEDRLDEVLVGVHRRIRAPELRAVTLAAQGIELLAKSWSPTGVLDAFPGVPLQITGRYSAAAAASRRAEASRTSAVAGRGPLQDATIVVRALAADGSAVEHHLVPLAGEGPLAAIWGRSRIRDLEDAYAVRGDESLASAIVATSLATGVLSRHTAFVAVDDAERVARAAGAPARLIQPVEAPAGWASLHNISGAPAAGAGAALIARGRRAHKREAAGAMGAASPLPARAMRSQIVPAPTAPPPTGSAPTAPPVAAPPVAVPPAAVASAAKLDDTAWVPRQDEDTEAALACQPAHGEDPVAVQHEVAKPMPAGHGDELGEASDVVREIAEIARQGRLDRAAALRAAMRLIEVLLALLEWGEDESELAVALRRLVTVLVEGDGAAAALAADAVSVLLAASSAALTGNRRGGAFWRRRPATPAG